MIKEKRMETNGMVKFMSENSKGILAFIFLGSIITSGIVCGVNAWNYYADYQYPLEQAKGYLSTAQSGGTLEFIRQYLIKANDTLKDYSGNPQWWFPTEDTSFDQLKLNINATITGIDAFNGTVGSMEYQQYLHNLQTIIEDMIYDLDQIYQIEPEDWLTRGAWLSVWLIASIIIFLLILASN